MKKIALLAAATMAVALGGIATAEAGGFKVYGMVAMVSPLSESDQDVGGVTDAVKASSEFGYNFGIEFKAGSMLGIELDYLYAKEEIEHDTAGLLGETTFQPISGTLNFHLPMGMLDLYGGPTASYVNWGDLEVPSGGADIELDPQFTYGISAGLDVGITKNLAATGGLRWLSVQAKPAEGGGDELDVNPLFARFGIAARF